jgi:hypothetical protein
LFPSHCFVDCLQPNSNAVDCLFLFFVLFATTCSPAATLDLHKLDKERKNSQSAHPACKNPHPMLTKSRRDANADVFAPSVMAESPMPRFRKHECRRVRRDVRRHFGWKGNSRGRCWDTEHIGRQMPPDQEIHRHFAEIPLKLQRCR